MSFPEYKDFAKCVRDEHEEGFDTDITLAVNSKGPCGVGLTTTTAYAPGASVLGTKLEANWEHSCGFAIDKLEIAGCNDIHVESSFKNAIPGVTFNFAGDKGGSGVIGAVYAHNLATISTDVDVCSLSTQASVLGGAKGVSVGASVMLGVKGGVNLNNYSAAVGYSPHDAVFAGIQANNKFADLNGGVRVKLPQATLSAMVDYNTKVSEGACKASVAAAMEAAGCQIKVKANNVGVVNAAVTREFPRNMSVTAAAAVDIRNPQSYDFGIKATLG